jgi:serine/threonine protein kinase
VNILIDNDGRARLTGFHLATIALEQQIVRSPALVDDAFPWMSPELLEGSYLTKEADCYALGMVIYEVLSGQVPFSRSPSFQLFAAILKGKRPVRPQGSEGILFTDEMWEVLEHCWEQKPGDRLSAEGIFLCLKGDLSLLRRTGNPEVGTWVRRASKLFRPSQKS